MLDYFDGKAIAGRRKFMRYVGGLMAAAGLTPSLVPNRASANEQADSISQVIFGLLAIGATFKVVNPVLKNIHPITPVMTKAVPIKCVPDVLGPNVCSRSSIINVNYTGEFGAECTAFFPNSAKVCACRAGIKHVFIG